MKFNFIYLALFTVMLQLSCSSPVNEAAKRAACKQRLRQIAICIEQYSIKHNCYPTDELYSFSPRLSLNENVFSDNHNIQKYSCPNVKTNTQLLDGYIWPKIDVGRMKRADRNMFVLMTDKYDNAHIYDNKIMINMLLSDYKVYAVDITDNKESFQSYIELLESGHEYMCPGWILNQINNTD